jgi:SAM-dependent methyltransferase
MQQLIDVKTAARQTWGTGDYDAMMRQERLYGVGERLVDRMKLGPGQHVLDLACGTGNAAIPAARAGAQVTGVDLAPRMLETARRRSDQAGVEVEWIEADIEDLPFEPESFDVVLSTFGCMFAPRHEVVADEISRVLRPGGVMGIASWTPEGSIGDFFRTVGAHLPPPPEFVDPPVRWGEEPYVRELFEGTGITCHFAREAWDIEHPSEAAAVECYTTSLGPVAEARQLAEAEGRWPELDRDMRQLFSRQNRSDDVQVLLRAEYLVTLGHKEG